MLRKSCILLSLISFFMFFGCGISGTITTEDSTGIGGVTVTISNGSIIKSMETSGNGVYSFENLMPGTYIITPSHEDYGFEPETATVHESQFKISNPVISGIDFTGEIKPDLIVTSVAVTEVRSGYIVYDYTIKNIGSAPAYLGNPPDGSGFRVTVQAMLSNDEIFGNDDDIPACGKKLTGVLNPGDTQDGSYHCDADAYGSKYLIVMIDRHNVEDELDETNNTNGSEVFPELDLIPATLLTLDAGETVTYVGPNPMDDGATIMTITYNGDGTMVKNWTLPIFGPATCSGTWSYDGTEITMDHGCSTAIGTLETTEVYGAAFIYDNGNKLDLYSPIQDVPGDGSLLVGEYSLNSGGHTLLAGFLDMTLDVELETSVKPDGTWTSVRTTTYVGDITHDPPNWEDEQITEGTWGFTDNWLFELGSNYLIQLDDSFVLTKQP